MVNKNMDESKHANVSDKSKTNATNKIVILASFEVKADKEEEFQTIVKGMIKDSRAEPGCLSYILLCDAGKHNHFFFFEEWKDAVAFDTHSATAHFKTFNTALIPLAVAPTKVRQFEIAADGRAKASDDSHKSFKKTDK